MPAKPKKSLVVLDSSPPQRAEHAVKLFASIVAKMGLPWTAAARTIDDAPPAEVEAATRIVCVCPSEFRPLVESRFATVTDIRMSSAAALAYSTVTSKYRSSSNSPVSISSYSRSSSPRFALVSIRSA